jgi:hypothetical protein
LNEKRKRDGELAAGKRRRLSGSWVRVREPMRSTMVETVFRGEL